MIKTKKNCTVCQTILGQPKKWEGRLAERIYQSRYYLPSSAYSLSEVAREYRDKFSYQSLLNHCKRHQFLSEDDFSERHLRQAAKQAEKALLKQAITSTEVWQEVINKGMEDLKEGRLKLTANNLLGAARDKSNFEIKYAGQQLALMDMVFGFASGERLPEGVRDDTIEGELADTAGVGGTTEGREERSRAFYQSLAGDAPAPRAD
jgi:SOS response regulatory protein OraA/RecX